LFLAGKLAVMARQQGLRAISKQALVARPNIASIKKMKELSLRKLCQSIAEAVLNWVEVEHEQN